MKEFLYSFLITKLYGQNETIFYLPKEVEFKIEIQNGFVYFFLKFPILSMFKNRISMSINNLPPLIVQKEINSNLQIVCNYLKLLNSGKLAEKDLYIKNVSIKLKNENINTKFDAQSLPQKECEKLIKDYIGIKYPTYYQINSFINALSGQLKKFRMVNQLTAEYLIENGNNINKPYLKDIRVIMVKGFIENTQLFTQGAFNKLLYSQMDTFKFKVEPGNYNEDIQDEIAIKALSDADEIISFKKIRPSLIFFHEGDGQKFIIISTCDPNEKEYKDLLEVLRTQIIIENETNKINGKNKIFPILKEIKNYSSF